MNRQRIVFFVEGFTDIRFVVGLSEICDLTLTVPASTSDLADSSSGWPKMGPRCAWMKSPAVG